MSVKLLTSLHRLKHKVQMSRVCLGDEIHDEKKLGKTKELEEYENKYSLWEEVEKVLEDTIRKVENIYEKHGC